MKIICVLVTYNRLQLLKKSVEAILAQDYAVDELIICNNASTDGTENYLSALCSNNQKIIHISLLKNVGGAGGFHYGIKEAYNRGADWIWTMDDDCIPHPDALKKLIKSEIFTKFKSTLGFLCSRVDWVDGSICKMNIPRVSEDWTSYHPVSPAYSKVEICSFVSVLFRREAIRVVGLPVKEFFIWFDDVEFTRRVSKNHQCFYIADSVVVHETKDNYDPGDFRYLDEDSLWKFKYGIRNEVAYISALRVGLLRGFLHLGSRFYYLLKAERPSWYILQMMLAGISGFFFRYKKHIELPLE